MSRNISRSQTQGSAANTSIAFGSSKGQYPFALNTVHTVFGSFIFFSHTFVSSYVCKLVKQFSRGGREEEREARREGGGRREGLLPAAPSDDRASAPAVPPSSRAVPGPFFGMTDILAAPVQHHDVRVDVSILEKNIYYNCPNCREKK
jgi:hypothetical protein